MNWQNLPFINKVDNPEQFGNKVIEIAAKLNTNPAWLMIVMNNESDLKSWAVNPSSGATGLIQFMPSTAIGLNTSTAALQFMSNINQLEYVYMYFLPYKSKLTNAANVYLAVFFPLALFKDDSWQFPGWAVNANRIFDLNNDGNLTKGEFTSYVNTKYQDYINPNENNLAVLDQKSILPLVAMGIGVYLLTKI